MKVCLEPDCLQLIPFSQTAGQCPSHQSKSALPKSPKNSSQFSLDGTTHVADRFIKEEYYDGLTQMSPLLIRQAIQEATDLGLKTELEISKHLTLVYGGVLIENAALVEQHWPIMGPQPGVPAAGVSQSSTPLTPRKPDSTLHPHRFSRPISAPISTNLTNFGPISQNPPPYHPILYLRLI